MFLQHGVALVAPGDAGPWRPDRSDDEFDGGFVRRFATEIATGDVFLLRSGLATVVAVGIVASDYLYANAFDDVNGLDLQHARRVRWRRLPEASPFQEPLSAEARLAARESRCRMWSTSQCASSTRRRPPGRPRRCPNFLPRSRRSIMCPMRCKGSSRRPPISCRCTSMTQSFGEPPSEDELIVHFVVPFLRALGWPPERIAVKWRYVDVAVFRALPRIAGELSAL